MGKFFLFGMSGWQNDVKAATNVTAQITEGALGHAINRTMYAGEERKGWTIGLNQGRKAESATWTSSDTGVMTVDGDKSGATVKTFKEGTAVLTLTVVTNQGETVSDQCLISSVTTLDTSRQAAGHVKESASLYRGASTSRQSLDRKEEKCKKSNSEIHCPRTFCVCWQSGNIETELE